MVASLSASLGPVIGFDQAHLAGSTAIEPQASGTDAGMSLSTPESHQDELES